MIVRNYQVCQVLQLAEIVQLSDNSAVSRFVIPSREDIHQAMIGKTGWWWGVSPIATLTGRDLEILRLIAEGQSNARIAEHLVLSEKTVKDYVSNIPSKLHLADRTQAAVYAWREGMVEREAWGYWTV